ncbi:glycosyltransferase family 4 protein [Aquirufa aurantiipilula]|uniref:glycosyltransferase family 4 protein n=1 Tax=Aquirufa aurantiipilula TaxID=2696561 RepID=UPI001CAA7A2A|nr:glycosyltransferase family 4 protein [Aquirufa aurantiipilula]MBZ1326582.1 glycosyltransferase family 4 protein [Aquirufa aurantiipilula]
MKIAFFTENSYKGGLDTFLINLFNAWPDEQDELTLLCNQSHPGLKTIKNQTKRSIFIEEYTYFYTTSLALGQSKLPFSKWKIVRALFVLSYRLLAYIILLPWYVLTLAIKFRYSNYDRLMVVNGGYPASLLCRCAAIAWKFSGKKSKVIFNFHNYTVPIKWYQAFFENVIDREVDKASSYFISVTKHCLQSLKLRPTFNKEQKLRYIYNGIENPNPHQCKPNYHPEHPYCLMLATYEPRKGHLFLLQAFKKVLEKEPDIKLKVYGYSGKKHERERVINEVRRLGLEKNVELHEFHEDKISLLAHASLLVVPSQSEESFGLTIIEAMALGIPVVTTDVGGMPEVMEGSGAGMVCFASNADEFAEAMLDILQDPNIAAEMGEKGMITFANKYDASLMAREYNTIIKE